MNDFTDYTNEAQRTSEVDEILERNSISREAVSKPDYVCQMVLCENYEKVLPASDVIIGIDGGICPSCKDPMIKASSAPSDIGIPISAQPASDNERQDETASRSYEVVSSGLGERIADNLVPSFGETLVKYSETSLTHGFPPAVDALITKTGIDENRAALVLANFRDAYALAADWQAKAKAIVVTDESQTDIILDAKYLHKIIRDERINVEKRRKELKEPSLREGQLIDGVANVYKELLGPIEQHLLDQSRFIENRQAERRAKLAEERGVKLALFEIDPKMFPNLGDMTDEAFEVVYSGVREQYHSRKEAEKELERQRLERERAAQIENERLRKENERLEAERKAEAERSAEERRLKEIAEAKQKEAQDELDRQAAERQAEADRIAAEAEARRLAPDKDKLLAFARRVEDLANEFPDVDEKWTALAVRVKRGFATIATTIETEAA